MRARRTRDAPRTSRTNATDAWLRKREGKATFGGAACVRGRLFRFGRRHRRYATLPRNGHRAGSNRRSIAPRPSGYPRRKLYNRVRGARAPDRSEGCGSHRRARRPPPLRSKHSAPELHPHARALETQGFEPWTFCNVVCAATAHARLPGAPEVGLEPTTTRLRVLRSAD